MILPMLGIIAGSGDLPHEIMKIYMSHGGSCCIASINTNSYYSDSIYKIFPLGYVGEILNYFQEHKVHNIVIIGGIKRPDFDSLKVDKAGALLLARCIKQTILGDNNILTIVMNYIREQGFNVISPLEILVMNNQNLINTKRKPSYSDGRDIEFGQAILKALGQLDIGQSVIICDSYALGVEAAEGTNQLIDRCSVLRKKTVGGVLVKMSKSHQDMRLDVPVIGPNTILHLAKKRFNGLAVEKTRVIIIKSQEVQYLLNKNHLFLVYF